jgi:hypothetical protein
MSSNLICGPFKARRQTCLQHALGSEISLFPSLSHISLFSVCALISEVKLQFKAQTSYRWSYCIVNVNVRHGVMCTDNQQYAKDVLWRECICLILKSYLVSATSVSLREYVRLCHSNYDKGEISTENDKNILFYVHYYFCTNIFFSITKKIRE